MIFFEEISKTLPVLAWTSGNVLLYGNNILQVNGNEEQRKRFLPGLMDGFQVFGGYGYSMEYDIQRYVRDAAGTLSAGISNDRLGLNIAGSMGL